MPDASLALPTLMAFALLFGIKHGFDADHLAAIDGLARMQARRRRPRLARCCGALFSGGHGLVVLAAAWLLQHYGVARLPEWLDPLGGWISIAFLFVIGTVNLAHALAGGARQAPLSPLARWLVRLPVPQGWMGSVAVGALFALSFDTLSLAAWFGLAGKRQGGVPMTLLLTSGFVAGMVLTDAVNGIVVTSLIGKSEAFVEKAGRLFSIMVAGTALLVAGLGVAKLSSEMIGAWADGRELVFGACVAGTVLCAYMAARRQDAAMRS